MQLPIVAVGPTPSGSEGRSMLWRGQRLALAAARPSPAHRAVVRPRPVQGSRRGSQNPLGWKKPPRPSRVQPVTQHYRGTKCHARSSLKHLRGRLLHHLPGQPIPMSDPPSCEETHPNVPPKPPLVKFDPGWVCPPCTLPGCAGWTHLPGKMHKAQGIFLAKKIGLEKPSWFL